MDGPSSVFWHFVQNWCDNSGKPAEPHEIVAHHKTSINHHHERNPLSLPLEAALAQLSHPISSKEGNETLLIGR
jgi:hypothetical protein